MAVPVNETINSGLYRLNLYLHSETERNKSSQKWILYPKIGMNIIIRLVIEVIVVLLIESCVKYTSHTIRKIRKLSEPQMNADEMIPMIYVSSY